MSFLHRCKCGDTGNDGNGDNGPENCRNSEEEQKTCQSVGRSVWEAETLADDQGRDLIDQFDHYDSPRPYPQPRRNPDNGNQAYRAASHKPNIRNTVQNSSGFAHSVQFPCKETIYHIAHAT